VRPHLKVVQRDKEYVTIVATCSQCRCVEEFELNTALWDRWQSGELIQRVWPTMNPDMRELLISGVCGVCFDALFSEDEHNEEPYNAK
jgi:hypothetical protein